MVDQTRLPGELVTLACRDYREVARAIREMRVRGAPAIGVAAAFAVALAALASQAPDVEALRVELREVGAALRGTRPTAVNLAWAVERALRTLEGQASVAEAGRAILAEAMRISDEDEAMCRAIGRHGAELVPDGARVLTHCNAGRLATVSYGTALGVVRAAHEQGKRVHVFVDETRPLLQGARLTAWELAREGIPLTLITDSMAGYFMRQGQIDLAVVGADRIAANGDVANKIGTYSVAVLAMAHGVPLYVAAPSSTVDLSLASGEQIPIEERRPEEVLSVGGRRLAPPGVQAANPAFDVTPARYISAIVTEAGVIRPPFGPGLAAAVGKRNR
jgi:methylthioribose-1-phosphate isomerase